MPRANRTQHRPLRDHGPEWPPVLVPASTLDLLTASLAGPEPMRTLAWLQAKTADTIMHAAMCDWPQIEQAALSLSDAIRAKALEQIDRAVSDCTTWLHLSGEAAAAAVATGAEAHAMDNAGTFFAVG